MRDYAILQELTEIIGPSGFESKVQDYYAGVMHSMGLEISNDSVGNSYALLSGSPDLPKIMFAAHADTVGFMIKHIDDSGFIFTDDIGGWQTTDYRSHPNTEVSIINRKGMEIRGFFTNEEPLHNLSDAEMEESIIRRDLYIDIGVKDEEQTRKFVKEGDYAVFTPKFRQIGDSGTRIISTNLDDRLGLFILTRIADAIIGSRKKHGDIVFVSTVGEEVYSGFAGSAAATVQPDVAIVVDTDMSVDQIHSQALDNTFKELGRVMMGNGPVMQRGLGTHDKLFLIMENLADRKKVPYQIEVGDGCTDAVPIMSAFKGTRTLPLLIPCRNLHSPIETCLTNDIEKGIDLCTEACYEIVKKREEL